MVSLVQEVTIGAFVSITYKLPAEPQTLDSDFDNAILGCILPCTLWSYIPISIFVYYFMEKQSGF